MLKRKKESDPPKKIFKTNDSNSDTEEEEEEAVPNKGEYWAEVIIDWGFHNKGEMMYYVNSWEFQENVGQCSELLFDFHTTKVNGIQPPKWSFEEFDRFVKYINNLVKKEEFAVYRKLSERRITSFDIRNREVVEEIKALLRTQLSLISKTFEKFDNLKTRSNSNRMEAMYVIKKVIKNLRIDQNFGSISHFFDFIDRRHVITKELYEWERKVNEVIIREREAKWIRVVNDIDLEKPKLEEYITEYIIDVQFRGRVELEDEKPLVSCKCDNCYESRDECCTAVIGFPMVYTNKGLLSSKPFNTIIYECNSECLCGQNCPNRIIQKGRQFELEIFRTDSLTRGWGVRTLQSIPKGAFITQYTGEVISVIEAEKRPSTYLFDLSAHVDFSETEFTYVVDASKYGNITRFVNHSCAPNCRVLFAWVQRSSNRLLPIIALFAEQQIQPNEELTYDYSMESIDLSENSGIKFHQKYFENNDSNQSTEASNRPKQRRVAFKRVKCECGTDSCRNFLYS